MAVASRPVERAALRVLDHADHALNRLYTWRGNPLYQSGAIAVALLLVLIVTGLWLLLFYRVGTPYASVAAITSDSWVGQWVRGVHRYASDGVLVATAIHAIRMFAQGRSWGPRALAWVSGVVMVGLLYVVGLTGYVMVWDTFGYQVAREGARLVDALPVLSEPISRAFAGEDRLLGPFFFLNMFAHIAIPLGIALVLWLHVARVARPVLLPPQRLTIALVAALVAVSVAWPLRMQPEANPFELPSEVVIDVFYGFWLPLVRPLTGGVALLLLVAAGLAVALVPGATRRRGGAAPAPSVVDEDLCTGCTQCALDCPFDAISMVTREPGDRPAGAARGAGGRSLEIARVDPDLCVSCGICAGSCAPMAVGPAGRTGREQLAVTRARIAGGEVPRGAAVVLCCEHSSRGWGDRLRAEGAVVYPLDCAGSVHTSVVESFVRGGAGGVLVLSCPPRDCWNREGPQWLAERMYHEREAELKARVDRRRVRIADAGAADIAGAVAALQAFQADIRKLDAATDAGITDIEMECEPQVVGAPA